MGIRSGDSVDAFVGARISLRRSALGLSQTALAGELGVSFQQVQKYETGANRISASRLHRIATVLGTSVGTFFPPGQPGAADPDAPDVPDWIRTTRRLQTTTDGRVMVAAFPLIADVRVRRAVARIVEALARSA